MCCSHVSRLLKPDIPGSLLLIFDACHLPLIHTFHTLLQILELHQNRAASTSMVHQQESSRTSLQLHSQLSNPLDLTMTPPLTLPPQHKLHPCLITVLLLLRMPQVLVACHCSLPVCHPTFLIPDSSMNSNSSRCHTHS